MTIISATEFKNNLGYYLSNNDEEILITKNGKIIKKLSNPSNKLDIMNNIAGVLETQNKECDDLKYAYLKEKYNL